MEMLRRSLLAGTLLFSGEHSQGQEQGGLPIAHAQKNTAAVTAMIVVRHPLEKKEGWSVAETENFRLHHKASEQHAEAVGITLEQYRSSIRLRCFGTAGEAWRQRCEVTLYPSGRDYTAATGISSDAAPAFSNMLTSGIDGRVLRRVMHLCNDSKLLFENILPHEVSHVTHAGEYGVSQLPRWADEGRAGYSETQSSWKERATLWRLQQQYPLFSLRELFAVQQYPSGGKMSMFYLQSIALVEYLEALKGPQVLTAFIREAMKDGYDAALQKQYGMKSVEELDAAFRNYLYLAPVITSAKR